MLLDLGPLAVFVVAFNVLQRIPATADDAIFIATGLFIAAVLSAIAYTKLKTGRVPPVLIVTGVLVTIFGGLTILLHDENLIKLKVTAVNLFYASAIVISVLLRQNVWKLLFGHAFTLPDRIWTILALRWAGFFLFMALLNEYLRLTQTTEAWVNLRLIVFPLFLAFLLANAPLVFKHLPAEDKNTPA